jgi:uncharacterized membrane protein
MDYALMLLARWLHILSAALAIGVPIFIRFVLMPARQRLDEPQRAILHEAIMARWRVFVYVMIVVFLATGFWTFLGVARWRSPLFNGQDKFRYHLLIGIKIVIALGMFFISSALAGRSAALAGMRRNAQLWISILILLGLAIVVISGVLRFMPLWFVP